jgi:5'(3')-deoxyribonucleotidase
VVHGVQPRPAGEALIAEILLDCDCVCADFAGAVLDELNHMTGHHLHYQLADLYDYDIDKSLGLNAATSKELWRRIRSSGWVASIQPMEGAVFGVHVLRERGHHVRVLTSPLDDAPHWHHERDQWCAEWLGVKQGDMIHAHDKHLVRGDYFVDDKVSHLTGWQAFQRNRCSNYGRAIKFRQPWNASLRGFLTVSDFPSLVDLICMFED